MKQLLNSALVSSDDTQPHSIIAKYRFLNKNKQTNQTTFPYTRIVVGL